MVAQNIFHRASSHQRIICVVSQIGLTFHKICPPISLQTWWQQYCCGAFSFYSSYRSFSNPICSWSVWCRRAMIPGEIFTSFAKFQGFVSVNDFWFHCRLQELFASSFVFLVTFVLHGYEWIHWVTKSCTTIANRSLFRDSQPWLRTLWSAVIKSPNFSARGSTLPIRLLHGAHVIWSSDRSRNFGLWWNEYKHCACPNPDFS